MNRRTFDRLTNEPHPLSNNEDRLRLWVVIGALLVAIIAGLVIAGIASTKAKANTSLRGVSAPLAAQVQAILSECKGSKIVSTIDERDNNAQSYHRTGNAVDMKGNPKCMYAVLKRNWKGGYTVDYRRVGHIHISNGKREYGLHFTHKIPAKTKRTQYAHVQPLTKERY